MEDIKQIMKKIITDDNVLTESGCGLSSHDDFEDKNVES